MPDTATHREAKRQHQQSRNDWARHWRAACHAIPDTLPLSEVRRLYAERLWDVSRLRAELLEMKHDRDNARLHLEVESDKVQACHERCRRLLAEREEDFGQTLDLYGVGAGPSQN